MSQKCSSGNVRSYREDISEEIKLNTSQLHSALQPRSWKGRWSENHRFSAYACVLRLSRTGEQSCMPESLCLRHGKTLPCGGQRRDVSVPAQQVLILVLCFPVWMTSPFPVYIQHLLGGERGVLCFSILIFPHAPSSFGVCILKQNARPHVLLQ